MRDPALASAAFIICVAFCPSPNHGQGHPIPPGVREADKQTNAPIEPPVKFRKGPVDPTILGKKLRS